MPLEGAAITAALPERGIYVTKRKDNSQDFFYKIQTTIVHILLLILLLLGCIKIIGLELASLRTKPEEKKVETSAQR
jgi:hypothetical protein